jgi:hypothetical protein
MVKLFINTHVETKIKATFSGEYASFQRRSFSIGQFLGYHF